MTPPSSSRAEDLIREAISLGAEDLYFKADGEGATIRYRVSGFIVQNAKQKITDFQSLIAELKSHLPEPESPTDSEDAEWSGQFSLLIGDRTTWIQAMGMLDRGTEVVALRILTRSFGFDDLGLSPSDTATLDELLSFSQGVIIGCGTATDEHATTLNALLERLTQNGRRVASLVEVPDPGMEEQRVTQIEVTDDDFGEQVEILAGHFKVLSLGHLDSEEKVRAAFDLAADGHLVLGLTYTPPLSWALMLFLNFGIAPEELHAHFLGGWSQRMVRHTNGQERVALFDCMSREEASRQIFEFDWLGDSVQWENEQRALWNDAEEKIAQGLTTRENVAQCLPPL